MLQRGTINYTELDTGVLFFSAWEEKFLKLPMIALDISFTVIPSSHILGV